MSDTTAPTPANHGMGEESKIDQILNQTEIGAFIAKYKVAFAVGLVLLIVGVFGYGIWDHLKAQSDQEHASALHLYRQTHLKAKEVKTEGLVDRFIETATPMGSFAGMLPVLVETADLLIEKEKYAEAKKLVDYGVKTLKGADARFFLLLRLGVLEEESGNIDGAISAYESILKNPAKYMQDKVYLDLGRLYLSKGNKEKAKTSFKYVVDSGKEAEMKKVAQLFLESL
jgi:predicted negative regulator of RcsB-dependent stress response